MLTGARRAREFRVNELICIENEDLDDDGRYASDDDRDDAPSVSGMRDLALWNLAKGRLTKSSQI